MELSLDVEKMCKEISEKIGIDYDIVQKVLDAEENYLIEHGFAYKEN